MVREIVLETSGHEEWTAALAERAANVKIANCRPHGEQGMLQLVMINSEDSIKRILRAISSHPNVLHSELVATNDHRASGIIVTKDSPLCRTISETRGFCVGCYFNQTKAEKGSWRIVLAGRISLNSFTKRLQKKGISASIKQVNSIRGNNLLTFEQDEAVKLAEAKGYFAIPRSVGVRELAELLGMAPSTLDEVLRRAEGKLISRYMRETYSK